MHCKRPAAATPAATTCRTSESAYRNANGRRSALKLAETILDRCRATPSATMIEILPGKQPGRAYAYGEVLRASLRLMEMLDRHTRMNRHLRVGLVMQNSPEWVAADLALMLGQHTEVPVPLAFTADQARHLLAGADVCLVDAAGFAR